MALWAGFSEEEEKRLRAGKGAARGREAGGRGRIRPGLRDAGI